jgi:KaiC/GvpD/RAD55 family RecA-like ATPase
VPTYGLSWRYGGGGGPLFFPKSPWYTQLHGNLTMKTWLKLNFLYKLIKRARTKLYIAFESFKISLLLRQVQMYELKLKLKIHQILLHKTGHNFLESTYKMLHLLLQTKIDEMSLRPTISE